MTYLSDLNKKHCYGCEACLNVCPKRCISMITDEEGFRYPYIDINNCIHCNLCKNVCPIDISYFNSYSQKAFGGFHKSPIILQESTSGGAFSAICESFCDQNFVIFGAKTIGFEVFHDYIVDLADLGLFRQSKYVQSHIGYSYQKVKSFLEEGKKVVFSGTPCQVAGLKSFLKKEYEKLLLIEVICEGVPSPLFIQKQSKFIEKKKRLKVKYIDYRYKDKRWDYEVMRFCGDDKSYKIDRWFNPFWQIWLNHYMSRPSCYECKFACKQRVSDITLGDLWGVHIYCPDLYNKNKGCSLIMANTPKGKIIANELSKNMCIRELDLTEVIKYQSPLRQHIIEPLERKDFMNDLMILSYSDIRRKWYRAPSLRLVFKKYIFGKNSQKVFFSNIVHQKRW